MSGPIQRSWLSPVTWRQKRPGFSRDPVEVEPDHAMRASASIAAQHDLVAAADGEGQAVALVVAVGFENDIGGRIVGIRVHGVRAVEGGRGREAQVVGEESGDLGHFAGLDLGGPTAVDDVDLPGRIGRPGKIEGKLGNLLRRSDAADRLAGDEGAPRFVKVAASSLSRCSSDGLSTVPGQMALQRMPLAT